MDIGRRMKAVSYTHLDVYKRQPISSASPSPHAIPKQAPFFTLPVCPAPRFWLINVVSAIEKHVIGKNTKPSILKYAPQPADVYKRQFPG